MAGVQIYKSTDASAPVLTGQVGSLVALLDACLVNGYGIKPAAGWTKPFGGTNAAVYRNSPTLGTGFYLDVNDNAPGAGGAREAFLRGYEVATGIGTGSQAFPTVAQMGTGVVTRKSGTLDATARGWYIIANETVVYIAIETGDFGAFCSLSSFGDYSSYTLSDAYRCAIFGRTLQTTTWTFTAASPGNGCEGFSALNDVPAILSRNLSLGNYIARTWTGVGSSVACGKHTDQTKMGGRTGTTLVGYWLGKHQDGTDFQYPNGPDGGLYLAPVWLHHSSTVRGTLKGVWAPLQGAVLGHGDTFSGQGSLAGKTFLVLATYCGVESVDAQGMNAIMIGAEGRVVFEISNTWS